MFNLEEASEVKPDFDSGKSPRLSVAGFYGDHAVFQHGKCTVVKGKAAPKNKVFLTIGSVKLAVFANDFGEFAFKIPPMPVQSNLDMVISCGNESLKFTDIAFGNVYLASGQSNMQMKINKLFFISGLYHILAGRDMKKAEQNKKPYLNYMLVFLWKRGKLFK